MATYKGVNPSRGQKGGMDNGLQQCCPFQLSLLPEKKSIPSLLFIYLNFEETLQSDRQADRGSISVKRPDKHPLSLQAESPMNACPDPGNALVSRC